MTLTTRCTTLLMLVFLTAGQEETRVSKIIQSNSEFANALYSEVAKEDDSKNVFFSPLSIHMILALAYVGAGGQTAQEMATGLRLPADVDVVKKGFQQLLQGMNNTSGSVTLEIADKIYLAKDSTVKDEFRKTALQNFLCEVQNVDFNSVEETVQVINEWVEHKTHRKIKGMVSAEGLSPSTKLMLINAVYFKGTWEKVFYDRDTYSAQFHVTASKTKRVEMMVIFDFFILVPNKDIGANILELDYKGNTMSLVIILPFKVDGLSEVEHKLRDTNLTTIFESLRFSHEVGVYLPKFKLEATLKLNDHLKALGMTGMFDAHNADFSGMSDTSSYVSQVLHKAFIEVKEEGTKAAAATGMDIYYDRGSYWPKPFTFVADHPFIFILRSKVSGEVIFMGRFADPQ